MDADLYLSDPCGASSLPFWKTNAIVVPDDLLILRGDDPRLETVLQGYIDAPYFKLIHRMESVERPRLPDGYHYFTPNEKTLSEHIASCYVSERVSAAKLAEYRLHATFDPDLWLAIVDEQRDRIVASGIAEVDRDIREGILEWIQVSQEYRQRGWGRMIVNELLYRMRDMADFVMVSGKVNETSGPRALYERCGFEEAVIWHVIKVV